MKALILFIICLPLALTNGPALQEFVSGNNFFAIAAYKELTKTQPGNFLVSSFSVETVLALTQSGARDTTAEEIRTSLHLPDSQEKIEAAIRSLQPSLRRNELYTLQSANKIYVKNDFNIKNEFKKKAVEVFGTDLEKIDFKNREEAAKTMNEWVEERTEHKIKNLISADKLNDRTRTVLINALYFKGNWSVPFEKYATGKVDFYKNGKQVVQVDTMRDTDNRKYFESKKLNAKFLELEFEGGDVTMTVVLPNEREGIFKLENQLDQILQSPEYETERVILSLPKFKIETQIDFTEVLQNLGVRKAFKDDEADLSGIAGEKGDLVIDTVAQKAFIDVNEEGVEAAAATYVAVGVPLSGFFPITPPKEFKADHPFIFYIKVKDLILFAGRVVDPNQ